MGKLAELFRALQRGASIDGSAAAPPVPRLDVPEEIRRHVDGEPEQDPPDDDR